MVSTRAIAPASSTASTRSTPRARRPCLPFERLIHALHPWVAFGVMPLFALANAGVPLGGADLSGGGLWIFIGVIAGLGLGKPLGIAGFSLVASRMARHPPPRCASVASRSWASSGASASRCRCSSRSSRSGSRAARYREARQRVVHHQVDRGRTEDWKCPTNAVAQSDIGRAGTMEVWYGWMYSSVHV